MQEWRGDAAFETAVQTALRRVDAPECFAERVLARSAERERPGKRGRAVLARFTSPGWKFAYGVAALLALTAGGVHGERVFAERKSADAASAQFSEAMAVTNRALVRVSAQLQQGPVGQLTKVLDNGR